MSTTPDHLRNGAAAVRHRRANVITALLRQTAEALRLAETVLYPWLDLAIRLWLAQLFWVSGILKLADWDNALRLATYEYPVAWLDPVTAATLGIAIEVICPVLLAFGLGWRCCSKAEWNRLTPTGCWCRANASDRTPCSGRRG